MTREDLNQRPLSYSSLKEFALSPKHYIHYLTRPRIETADMLIGSAVHNLLLEDNFNEKYAVMEPCDKRTKAGKEYAEKFEAEHAGKSILTKDQDQQVQNMFHACMDFKPAKELIMSLQFTEHKFNIEVEGLPVVGYIDGLNDKAIVEIKTVQSSRPQDLIREFYNRMYHLQGGIYYHAHDLTKDVYYIAIEKTEPFNVTVLYATDDYLQKGIAEMSRLCSQFNTCLNFNLWNEGYDFWNTNGKIEILDLPKYAY